jgi:hypothetical protein
MSESRWSSVIVHPRSVPASRFLARLAAYELANGPTRLARSRRAAGLAAATIAVRHALGSKRPDPAVDHLLDTLHQDWSTLADQSPRLPAHPPARDAMSVVVLERSAARTVFVFGTDPTPLVVAKFGKVDTEEAALERARPAHIAPIPLGRHADAFVQEGVPGHPLALPDLRPSEVIALRWTNPFRSLGRAIARLNETTATRVPPAELGPALVLALTDDAVPATIRPAVKAAVRDAERIGVSVLRHGDLSGQNWLIDGDELTGIIDWETAIDGGVPGYDVLHAAVSWFEHVVRRGSSNTADHSLIAGFEAAWDRSPFFAGARRAALDAATAAGVPAPLHDALLVSFFVRRLGRRLRFGADHAATTRARHFLHAVCR